MAFTNIGCKDLLVSLFTWVILNHIGICHLAGIWFKLFETNTFFKEIDLVGSSEYLLTIGNIFLGAQSNTKHNNKANMQ